MVNLETVANPDLVVNLACKDRGENLDRLDHQDHRDQLVNQDLLGQQDLPDPHNQAHQDQQDNVVKADLLVHKVAGVKLVLPDQGAKPVH